MTTTQQVAVREDFLAWSGGQPPDSPFEIFTYCELAMPIGIDAEEVRSMLKKWMENAWQQGREMQNPTASFEVFRYLDEK
jgi:hypothetical protein